MDPERFARLREVVLTAEAMPAGQRAAYLNRACGRDLKLLGEAASLLEHSQGHLRPLATGTKATGLEGLVVGVAGSAARQGRQRDP